MLWTDCGDGVAVECLVCVLTLMVMLKVNEVYPSLLDWSTLCLTSEATQQLSPA